MGTVPNGKDMTSDLRGALEAVLRVFKEHPIPCDMRHANALQAAEKALAQPDDGGAELAKRNSEAECASCGARFVTRRDGLSMFTLDDESEVPVCPSCWNDGPNNLAWERRHHDRIAARKEATPPPAKAEPTEAGKVTMDRAEFDESVKRDLAAYIAVCADRDAFRAQADALRLEVERLKGERGSVWAQGYLQSTNDGYRADTSENPYRAGWFGSDGEDPQSPPSPAKGETEAGQGGERCAHRFIGIPGSGLHCVECGEPEPPAPDHGGTGREYLRELLATAVRQANDGERASSEVWHRHFTCLAIENVARAVERLADRLEKP